jgi:hypothetical protein
MAAKKTYSASDLKYAIAEMQEGKPLACLYGIPPTTLHNHNKRQKKIGAGGPTVLTHSEEQEIALTCVSLADMGFGLTRDLISDPGLYARLKNTESIHGGSIYLEKTGGNVF